MKKVVLVLLLAFFAMVVLVQAQPDPRDSIILESKAVVPGAHPGSGSDTAAYVYLKVYITNKDSLAFVTLPLTERSTSGGAYMTLARPRNFDGMVNRLTTTLGAQRGSNPSPLTVPGRVYNSVSPDTLAFFAGFDPLDPSTIEPPNVGRKALWEIKFDTVFNNAGTIEFDTTRWSNGFAGFTNTDPIDYRVNFIKSVITVVTNPLKGDLNLDGEVRVADVVLELYCVYLGTIPPAGPSACDVNCDGQVSPADVAVFLNYKFITLMWPC